MSFELLPVRAKTKLNALRQSKVDAQALAHATIGRVSKLEQEIASVSLIRNQTISETGEVFPESKQRHKTLTDEINRLQGELEAVREINLRRQEGYRNDALILGKMEHWVKTLPAGGIEIVNVDTPVPKSTDLVATVNSLRDNISALKVQRRALRGAPIPHDDLKKLAENYVERLVRAAGAQLTVYKKAAGDLKIEFHPAASPLNIIAWAYPEMVLRAVEREIEQAPSEDALPMDERTERIKHLDRLILQAERSEEAAIEQAAVTGQTIHRRTNASPEAVLGIEVVIKSQKKAGVKCERPTEAITTAA